jgi:hypothetical protein
MYWRLDTSTARSLRLPAAVVASSGVKPVLQQLLVAASMYLTSFVDAPIPDRWEAAVRMVQDDRKCSAVFGEGVWMVPWREFVTHAQHSLCMVGEAETLAFARHVEKIGAVLLLGCGVDDVSGGVDDGDSKPPHRWVVCILHDPELVTRMLLPSREIVRVQVARVSGIGGATGMRSAPHRQVHYVSLSVGCVRADVYELRKEFGDLVSLRAALSLECEQRSIVLPDFPRVPWWFESPSRHDARVHRTLLEVCAGVLCEYRSAVVVFSSTVLHRDDLRRWYYPGVASEGCQSSDAV